MAITKRDYRSERTKYKSLIRTNSDTKATVAAADQRSRAELYDAIEDFFRGGAGSITPEKDRALMSMIVSSGFNSQDDLINANDVDWSTVPTTRPRDANKVWSDRGILKIT
jgi:hypothetical protein